ncbi:hypothetical protein [Nocardia sp. NPDC050406]|uniref:hypothetical protein n=1 Tax=Nocardia sp. NPDC050406 TaxID=3364318 RepID=UPI00378FB973
MDPNTALTRIRELIIEADALSASLCHDDSEVHSILYDLTEAVEGLDRWISRGGFLPECWTRRAEAGDE